MAERPESAAALAPLVEVLDTARDGEPRWLVVETRAGHRATQLVRQLTAEAERRGFLPVDVQHYRLLGASRRDVVGDRTLFLVAGPTSPPACASAVLADAASWSPRPHMLLSFRAGGAAGRTRFVVREAKAAYGTGWREPASGSLPPDVVRHVSRGLKAADFERSGRHAAAERLLRDVAGALARRMAWGAAAATLARLARLLIERGRPVSADAVCDEAAEWASRVPDNLVGAEIRLWQAVARTDAGRLTDAESLCRACLLGNLPARHSTWARAILARVLLWQGRDDEAARLGLREDSSFDPAADGVLPASTAATTVRVLVATGELFDAGLEARRLVDWASTQPEAIVRVIAHTAHLRLQTATGDLTLAAQTLRDVQYLARQGHVPLRAARARLIWYDALVRAGDGRVRQEREYLDRIRRVVPPLLRAAIESRLDSGPRARGSAPNGGRLPGVHERGRPTAVAAMSLLRIVQDEPSEERAIRRVLGWLHESSLQPSRVDVISCDAGPSTTLLSVGSGLATQLGARVIEAGIAIRERVHGGQETALPVRQGAALIGALAVRWTLDAEPSPAAGDILDVAAHVLAAPLDALLRDARLAASASADVPELVGASAGMEEVRRAVRRAAAAPFAVLIEGESGSGKELVARAIHQLGPRRERKFCDINCAALPDELLDSELFGHARGAFTGAVSDRPGLFEEANGGTLFLDEVPDLSPRGQAKLLRAIQQQEVRRVGESFTRPVDVRIVAAANRDMRREADAGRFRHDLLYRLDVIRIAIPPLRDRPDDIPLLADRFWRVAAARIGTAASLTHGTIAALVRYPWPGNVRELQNVIAALAVAAPATGRVRESLLPARLADAATTSTRLDEARTEFEKRLVGTALGRAGGNRTRAAAELGLSRQGLLKTMARLGIGSG